MMQPDVIGKMNDMVAFESKNRSCPKSSQISILSRFRQTDGRKIFRYFNKYICVKMLFIQIQIFSQGKGRLVNNTFKNVI